MQLIIVVAAAVGRCNGLMIRVVVIVNGCDGLIVRVGQHISNKYLELR